jgi:ParB-like chromosome segregation protein Spo0J
VSEIAASIEANGFFGALVVHRPTGRILIGNHRYQAAVAQGLTELPALLVDCDESRALRIMLADNKIAEMAHWNADELLELLSRLAVEPFALAGTGFIEQELAAMINPADFTPADDTNRVDVSAEHECPSCGYRWRVDAAGQAIPA